MKVSGIYLIKCTPLGMLPRYYVGQSSDLMRRRRAHFSLLKTGKHFNRKMQNSYDKHGRSCFEFEIVELCSIDQLDTSEAWWLSEIVGFRRCFNIGTEPSAPMRGVVFSEEHRQKIARSQSGSNHYSFGKALSDAHRALISAGGKGKSRSEKTKKRISDATSGENNPMFGMRGKLHPRSKPVVGKSILTGSIIQFDSMEMAESSGFAQECISRCCSGISKSHKGYSWMYADNAILIS